jgi:hypothetical protein
MSKNKNFNKVQKHLIKQCMIDAAIIGLGKDETITYVKSRLNLDFSEGSYKKYRSEVLNGNDDEKSNVQWITYFARQGFVEFYRKRIVEMEMIQKETFNQWFIEINNKPDSQKDKNLILKLIAELRANNQQLTSLGMVTPIIATIKNLIDDKKDKDKIDDASTKFINHHPNHHYPIQNLDDIEEDTNTTTEGSKDMFSDSSSSSLDRSTNTEYDPNRKF